MHSTLMHRKLMHRSLFTGLLLSLTLVLGACLGGGTSENNANPDADSPPAAEEPAEDSLLPTPTPAPEADAPAAADDSAEADDSAAPTEDDAPAASADAATVDVASVQTVEDAAAINSYRLRVQVDSQTRRGESEIVPVSYSATGDYVKEPPAQQLLVTITEGEDIYELGMIIVDGQRFLRSGETWVQTPEAQIYLEEMTLITAGDGRDMLGNLTAVGMETIDGRAAMHYQGDKDTIPVVGTEGDTFDASRADTAQIDIWVDAEYNAISRLQLQANMTQNGQEMSANVLMEYYDFNADVTVTPPEGMGGADSSDTGSAEPVAPEDLRGPVSELLGFNLLLPTGSNIELNTPGVMLIATTPYTFDEAQNWIETNFEHQGYTLVTQVGPVGDQVVYSFQGNNTVTVTIAPDEQGGARVHWAVAP